MKIYVPEEENPPQYPQDNNPSDTRAKIVFFVVLPILFVILFGSLYLGFKQEGYQSGSVSESVKNFTTELQKSFRESVKIDGQFPRSLDKFPTDNPQPSPTMAPTITPAPTEAPVASPTTTFRGVTTTPQRKNPSPTTFMFPTIPPGELGSEEWKKEFKRKFEETKKKIENSRKE